MSGGEGTGERLVAIEKDVESLKSATGRLEDADAAKDRRLQAVERFQAAFMVGVLVIGGFLAIMKDAIARAIVRAWPL